MDKKLAAKMLLENEANMLYPMYKTSYAFIDRGDGVRCGWCEKPVKNIKNVDKHLKKHEAISTLTSGEKRK